MVILSARIYTIFNSTFCICGNELHIHVCCCRKPAQTGIPTYAIQKIHLYLHTMQQNKLTKRSNIIHSKVKQTVLSWRAAYIPKRRCSYPVCYPPQCSMLPFSVSCVNPFVPVGTRFQLHSEKIFVVKLNWKAWSKISISIWKIRWIWLCPVSQKIATKFHISISCIGTIAFEDRQMLRSSPSCYLGPRWIGSLQTGYPLNQVPYREWYTDRCSSLFPQSSV